MKPALKKSKLNKTQKKYYYYNTDNVKIYAPPHGITGNLAGIIGDLTGIIGDLTDISGNIDDCEITDQERKAGINIKDLI